MNTKQRIKKISAWIKNYATKNKMETLVIGISGGIDSSVVSTLCAMTGIKTIAVVMPIKQSKTTHSLSVAHGAWLQNNFNNVEVKTVDLNKVWKAFENLWEGQDELALANSRARLRMTTLYQIAQSNKGIVVGTGNKIEDFGVGFFTKYGDGGVDISPIADCLKSEVWSMGAELNVMREIIEAAPTDGLWADGRTDEDQLGMSYGDLELAMIQDEHDIKPENKEQRENLKRYRELHKRNLHKMIPIPICKL